MFGRGHNAHGQLGLGPELVGHAQAEPMLISALAGKFFFFFFFFFFYISLSLLENLSRLSWVRLQQPQEQRHPVLQMHAGSFVFT